MKLELSHTTDELLHHVFNGNESGYVAVEVDAYLDEIIQDYYKMMSYYKKSEETIEKLSKENAALKEEKDRFEVENRLLQEKMNTLSSQTSDFGGCNLDLLKRISALEAALYNAGIDPNKIN